ncbi:MAG TPA: helix-turn-helix domain-containing protein [Streptosporangiaceae bacterium]|nr:helix-turn-helix domain-containing protein [Streptosporangiaceae bacterium]
MQGDLLALLFLHPEDEYNLSEIAAVIGTSVKTVQQEVVRLVDAGILAERRSGNQRMVRAATDTILSRPLTDLLSVTFGPLPLLVDLLGPIADVDEAYIYGSWAARYQGGSGPIPADVDVLVIGSPTLDDLDDVAEEAQRRLRRPVNIRRIRPDAWHDPDPADPFLASIRSRPLVMLEVGRQIVNDDDSTED